MINDFRNGAETDASSLAFKSCQWFSHDFVWRRRTKKKKKMNDKGVWKKKKKKKKEKEKEKER